MVSHKKCWKDSTLRSTVDRKGCYFARAAAEVFFCQSLFGKAKKVLISSYPPWNSNLNALALCSLGPKYVGLLKDIWYAIINSWHFWQIRDWTSAKVIDFSIVMKIVQLNKYETAPNFIQLYQNLISDCL